jgi:hypothetical protein
MALLNILQGINTTGQHYHKRNHLWHHLLHEGGCTKMPLNCQAWLTLSLRRQVLKQLLQPIKTSGW